MSFVSRLRMANMFPIKSNLGDAQIDIDELDNIIGRAQLSNSPMRQPIGMQMMRPPIGRGQPLQFGGEVMPVSNPGADILNRSKMSAEQTYANYGKPQPQAPEFGPSRDEKYTQQYFDNKNKEKVADAALINAQGNSNYKQAQLDNQEERLRNEKQRIEDAKSKNQTQAELNQAKFDLTKSKSENEKLSQDTLKKNQRDSIVTRAQAALEELNRLKDNKSGQLTTRGKDAFGGINNMIANWIPWSTDSYDASTTRERLKNLLTLDLLGEMKAQSKTGATGFGQMNLRELGVLENAASRLTGKLSDADAPGALSDVEKYLNLILADESPNNSNMNAPQAPEGWEYVRRPDGKGWTAVRKGGQ